MRTMQHNSRASASGRVHGTKHNDRNFDVEKADNIDSERSSGNIYENCFNDFSLTFDEVELKFYEEAFGEQLRKTNEKYEKNGHAERCKTMAEWKMLKRNAPEETTMQIGKMEEHVSADVLMKCYREYSARLEEWNLANGNPFTTLTTALHVDEAVPHVQTRRVWHYATEDGSLHVGQEKALAAAGVELPCPDLPEGRKNNRKAVFDKMCREMWLDVLHERGLDIERVPVPDGKHNRDKEEMIRDKYEALIKETAEKAMELEQVQSELEEARRDVDIAQDTADKYDEISQIHQQEAEEAREKVLDAHQKLVESAKTAERLKRAMDSAENKKMALEGEIGALEGKKEELATELPSLEQQVEETRFELEVAEAALKEKNEAGARQFGMGAWMAQVQQSRERTKEEKRDSLLARFAEYIINTVPGIRELWQRFQREHERQPRGKVHRPGGRGE